MTPTFKYDALEIQTAVDFKIKHKLSVAEMHTLGWYLSRILLKFSNANLVECADRWIAGKRAITLPWTKLRKKNSAAMRKSLSKDKPLILAALESVDDALKQQYLNGKDKALNAIVGKVIAATKLNPAAVKHFVVEQLDIARGLM